MRKALKPSLILGIILILLTLVACGIDGDYKTNTSPEIAITSWEGDSPTDPLDVLDTLVFQQKIYWNSYDKDGTVEGIAYRILDENNVPMSTYGNSVIDSDGSVETLIIAGEETKGWVVHYKDGADESINLQNSPSKTIWSDQQYAVVNFPASDEFGEPVAKNHKFEVVCIDNSGAVSNLAMKYFIAKSDRPNCLLSTSKGNPDGDRVGTGIVLTFALSNPDDGFVVPGASDFEFKVVKKEFLNDVEEEDNDILENDTIVSESEWISTADYGNLESFQLTLSTEPAISTDFESDDIEAEQKGYTEIFARSYNLAGVVSAVDTIRFAVKEGFHPQTLLYPQKNYALGDFQYVDYPRPAADEEVYPYLDIEEPNPDKFAVKMFTDMLGLKKVVNSANLRTYIKWGYHGEYGTPPESGDIPTVSDNPYDKKINLLLDEETNINYYSVIMAYDLRLDDAPYTFFALQDNVVQHVDEETGEITDWLRVPVSSVWDLAEGLELANLSVGHHKFEVCAYDLQDQYDPTPAIIDFSVVDYTPMSEREGVLVIDADQLAYAEGATWNESEPRSSELYETALGQFTNVTYVNRATLLAEIGLGETDCAFAPSDLLRYKTVIYRNESFSSDETFQYDNDAMNIFLAEGGNLILSGTKSVGAINQKMVNSSRKLMRNYFGIAYSLESVDFLSANSTARPYFIGADPVGNYPSLDLDLVDENSPDGYSGISFLIERFQGIGGIGFFTDVAIVENDTQTKPIYSLRCKPVPETGLPSQEDFDMYNGKAVGFSRITDNNKCYVFTFPLSYMKQAQLTELLGQIVEE